MVADRLAKSVYLPVTHSHPCLVLPTAIRGEILHHLRRCLPHEGVGLLATDVSGDASPARAIAYYAGENADRSAVRYTMRPMDVALALRDMERRGLRLGAVVHSHPRTPPVPSATDLAEATGSEILSVIVGFTPVVTLRAWQLVGTLSWQKPGYQEVRVVGSWSEQVVRVCDRSSPSGER